MNHSAGWHQIVATISARFAIGYAAGATLSLGFLFIARSYLITTIQTAESAPHYEVLYAGLNQESFFAAVLLLPMAAGLIALKSRKRPTGFLKILTLSGLALLLLFANVATIYTMMMESIWLGMD